jgi:hypothetical protein
VRHANAKEKTMKIMHEERFTDVQMATMFNVDLAPTCKVRGKLRVRWIEAPYAFNDCKMPLLVVRKSKKSTKRVRHFDDTIKSGVTIHEPGSKGRVADMVKFYAANAANEVSAFEV